MNLVASNYTTIDVHQSNGILVTTSRNVAAVFGKEHKNVLADIRNIIASNSDEEFGRLNFQQSTYRRLHHRTTTLLCADALPF